MKMLLVFLVTFTLGACTTVRAPEVYPAIHKTRYVIIGAGVAYCYHVSKLRKVIPIDCETRINLFDKTIELVDLSALDSQEFTNKDKRSLEALIAESFLFQKINP